MHFRYQLALAILALALCHRSNSEGASAAPDSASKLEAYQSTLNTVVDNINKASEKSQALIDKHMAAVDKDPGSLITKEAMQRMMQSNSLLPQKAGTRSITVESQQGFNGISNYQPSGWKITETMGTEEKKQESANEKMPVYTYPSGLGPVLLNACTGSDYSKSSPCVNSKLVDPGTICVNMMDAANYVGVGFDGRGYYRSESRRSSLIQRSCIKKSSFMGQEVPDTMTVFGIFETTAETRSFQSADDYMSYIRDKAGLSEQKNLFTSEASKFSKASSFGANLGAIFSIVGAAAGAAVAGPAGASAGATLGGAVGGSIGGGSGTGSGSQSATDKGQSSSSYGQTDQSSLKQSSSSNFFAILYVNVVLYEISLDDVKPTDINLAALKDYMSLPVSYFSVGADVNFQHFLLRWGTHYIRSGKFGGQLKITKTAKTDKISSQQEFASLAETEFQSMFSTLQSKYSQESSSWSFLGFGEEKKQATQSDSATSKSESKSSMNSQNQLSQSLRQSEFTQTTVEAQGGTPEIAEALIDFYTPAFKQLFHTWIVSIKDYAKPFEFQLRPVNEMFNLNMDSLFPAGNLDFGCVGDGSQKVNILVDPDTKRRYYIDTRTDSFNNTTVDKKVRVNCMYSSISDFKQDMERRMVSLERAVGVYMAEGPFPTSSFELPAGQPGCEEATVAELSAAGSSNAPLKFTELHAQPFIIAFDLPESLPNILEKTAQYKMIYRFEFWYAVEPNNQLMHLYDGCKVPGVKATDTKICFKNIILTYDELSGMFIVSGSDFASLKALNPSLPYWLSGTPVGRSIKLSADASGQRPAIPCNVKWLNSHRLDPNKPENCIHFTAATEGDLFLIFASIPKDKTTWYYLQITADGVGFYQSLALQKTEMKKGMGVLGDKNLFQSFFVCVIQKDGVVTMQYGKADPDSELGTVYSAYTFVKDSQFSQLSFYSFGSGRKSASLMDVRQTKKMPEVICSGDAYVKKDGACVLVCHSECNGCHLARDSKGCQQCKNMRAVTGSGTNQVTECVAQCPVGWTLSTLSQGLCIPCTPGTFKATVGNEACAKCAQGSASPEGAATCAGCPDGTYSDTAGSQQCLKCPAGKFAKSGAASCTNCTAGSSTFEGQSECSLCSYGEFGATAGAVCAKCAAGSYSESRGATNCTLCAVGYYQPATGQSKCIIAPKGSYVNSKGASAVSNCPAGQIGVLEGQTACKPCPAGTIAASSGSTSCTSCPAGYWQPSSGNSACVNSYPGNYVDTVGATSQKECPAGSYSARYASTYCTRCPVGYWHYLSGRSECAPSNPAHYVDTEGATGEKQCPAGTYSAKVAATSCTKCPVGTWHYLGARTECAPSNPGRYVDTEGATSEKNCPAGLTSNQRATSVSSCFKAG